MARKKFKPLRKKHFEKAFRLNPSPETGLSAGEVTKRMEEGYVNFNFAVKTKSTPLIVLGHLLTLFNLINIIIFIALLWVGSYKNLMFIAVIAANILIGVIQEIRAKNAVEKLSFLTRSPAMAVRDGVLTEIEEGDIVLDDVIAYKAGDQVKVDCVMLTGECEVNESFVTGEGEPVLKQKGDLLFAGSFISGGECRAKTDKIADQSYISTISKSARTIKVAKSVLLTSLKRLITFLSIVILPLGTFLFIDQYKIHGFLSSAIENTSAALIGMIPQGLMLLISTALALSVVKLSKKNVLVKDLYSVEMLARVDVVCLDKTGTLTEGSLHVEKLISLDQNVPNETLLSALALALGGENATMEAVGEAYPAEKGFMPQVIKKVPFSSKTKWSGAVLESIGGVVIGAPEYVMPQSAAIAEETKKYSENFRVLLLCKTSADMEFGVLPSSLTPAALVLLRDKMRREAPNLVAYLDKQGVEIKIISGDAPLTVSAVARRAGVPGYEKYIDCSAVASEKELKKAATLYTVFGRVSPFQKRILIKALKRKKHTVAMTGDGVNDVLAMKEADCSVAMGSGTDAARNVAKIVLLRSDFDALPAIIAEGRRSINNIQRSASFFLIKTTYATLMAFIFLLLHKPYPFQPVQQSLVAFACIGFPSVVLALEPNKDRIRGNFFGNVMQKALPGGLVITLAATLAASWNDIAAFFAAVPPLSWGAVYISPGHIPTMVLYITGFVSFLALLGICFPPKLLCKMLFLSVAVMFVGGIVLFKNFLDIASLSLKSAVITVILCVLAGLLLYFISRLLAKTLAFFTRLRRDAQ